MGALFVSLGCLFLFALPVAPVFAADVFSGVCEGAAEDSTVCQDLETDQTRDDNSFYGPDGILTRAARLIGMLVGIASIILIIIGGFKYVVAAGDPSKITSARDTILYAVLGILLAISTQAIVIFVLRRL